MRVRNYIYGLIFASGCCASMAKAKELSFPEYEIETIATGLSFPWSLAFLPEGNLLVT